jgi:hypothetical protein
VKGGEKMNPMLLFFFAVAVLPDSVKDTTVAQTTEINQETQLLEKASRHQPVIEAKKAGPKDKKPEVMYRPDLRYVVLQMHSNPVEIKKIEKQFGDDSVKLNQELAKYEDYINAIGIQNMFILMYRFYPQKFDSVLTEVGGTLFDSKGVPICGTLFVPQKLSKKHIVEKKVNK